MDPSPKNSINKRLSTFWERYSARSHRELKRGFWIHGLALVALYAIILFVVRPYPDICYLSPAGWFRAPGSSFYFWLPFFLTLLFAVHFFIVSALTVDEDAMVAKSREIRSRATDFGHMEDIMDRQWDGDDSVVSPFDPRRKTDAFGQPKTKKTGTSDQRKPGNDANPGDE